MMSQTKTLNQMLLKTVKILLLCVLSFTLTACSDFLKGKPKEQDYIEINNQNMSCLDNLADDMKKLLDAGGTADDVDSSVACISKVLTEFQLKVEGRQDKNSFTALEIYDIFKTFAPGANLSQIAAQNVIALKAALLGGGTDKITKTEITELIKYLEIVKVEAKTLLPYFKVYFLKETNREYSQLFIREAFTQLNGSIKRLLQASKIANSTYSFNEFKTFLINVLNLADQEANMVEIMARINYVLNGAQTELSDSERLQYVDNITEFLRLYSVQANGYVRIDFKNIDDLDNSVQFIHEGLALLENSLQFKKTGIISANSIDRLLVEVAAGNFFRYPVRASSMIGMYKAVMTRMFESAMAGAPLNYTGIKTVNFINIKRELAAFQIYSRIIRKSITQEAIDAGISSYNVRELQRVIGSLSASAEQDILVRFDANNQYQIASIVNELKSHFLQTTPIVYNRKKMGVAINQETWNMTRDDLVTSLFNQMFTRLLMLGYSPTYQVMNVSNQVLTDVSLYTWYSEFKAFMTDIKNFDPRTFNSGSSLLKTGNLFTRTGNGDTFLTYSELHESMATQMSGGGPLLKEMEADLDAARCDLPELDVFDKHWKIESCFDQLLKNNYRRYFSSLPHLLIYLESLSADQFTLYFRELLNVARYNASLAGQRIETTDITMMNTMLFFIEQVFLIHDSNRNNMLSESEIRIAYPKFKLIATEFAETSAKEDIEKFTSWMGDVGGFGCFSREELIEESFIFLVYNGRTPSQSDFNSFPCFTGKPLINFSGEVSRMKLTQTFKSLKNVIAP